MKTFVFEKEFTTGSYNLNFLVHEKNTPERKWVVKISKIIGPQFVDLNDRALLAYRLSKLAKVRLVETESADIHQCEGLERLSEWGKQALSLRVSDVVTVTKFSGVTVSEFLRSHGFDEIQNFEEFLNNFVFNLWIGNYDRKLEDYVIQNSAVSALDYQLFGPGFADDLTASIGAYAQPYHLNDVSDTGWCLEGRLDNQVGALLKMIRERKPQIGDFQPYIQKIRQITNNDIATAFDDLALYNQGGEKRIHEEFQEFLRHRRDTLEKAISDWITAGYPISARPVR